MTSEGPPLVCVYLITFKVERLSRSFAISRVHYDNNGRTCTDSEAADVLIISWLRFE